MKKRIRQFLPWLIALVIFYFLFRQIPPKDVLLTFSRANIPLFFLCAIAYFFIFLSADSWGLWWVINRFSTFVTYKETLLTRGASYLLTVINYNLGQGGIAFYLKRTHQAPIFKTLGAIFYLSLIDLTVMMTCGLIAALCGNIVYRGLSLSPLVIKVVLIYYLLLALWFVFWANVNRPIMAPLKRLKIVNWILHRTLFYAFRESRGGDLIQAFAIRIPATLLILAGFYICIYTFRSFIPIVDIALYTPPLMIVGTLPITPAGLGTVQALCIEFFKTSLSSPLVDQKIFSVEQILLSASLFWAFTNLALKAIFGFYCLKKESKSLFEEMPTES